MRSRYAILILAAVFTACEASPVTQPEAIAPDPLALEAPSLNSHSHGAVLHTVAGGGTLNYLDGDELIAVEHYGFNATLHADGTATGQLQGTWDWPNALDRLHAEVVCAEVNGNQAGIVVSVTKAMHKGIYSPFPEGFLFGFAVRDNGEGTNADPDEISYFYGPIQNPPFACHGLAIGSWPFLWPQFEWTHGNVQIKNGKFKDPKSPQG